MRKLVFAQVSFVVARLAALVRSNRDNKRARVGVGSVHLCGASTHAYAVEHMCAQPQKHLRTWPDAYARALTSACASAHLVSPRFKTTMLTKIAVAVYTLTCGTAEDYLDVAQHDNTATATTIAMMMPIGAHSGTLSRSDPEPS